MNTSFQKFCSNYSANHYTTHIPSNKSCIQPRMNTREKCQMELPEESTI